MAGIRIFGFPPQLIIFFVIKTIIDRLYCLPSQVLEPGYEFLKGYSVPAGTDVNIFRRHIDENLPAVDVPEVVGLNQNADLTYRLQQVWRETDRGRVVGEVVLRKGGSGVRVEGGVCGEEIPRGLFSRHPGNGPVIPLGAD